jgi:hypothetical protein
MNGGQGDARPLFKLPPTADVQTTRAPFLALSANIKQTVWKRLRLSGDKSRKLISAMFEHSGAECRL